ncbi:MAG TPA: ABC transporter permease [Tepidisphaeraceae bacterium]|jgi:simple sugar transport system permease protein|nr:ABC transporter permease [Tepidisphaeraceae bacterium]
MTLPYVSRPTLVFRAKRLIPASFVDAIIISTAAMIISLALFGLFVMLSGVNPFDVYHFMYKGAFGNAYAWRNTLIHAAPLLLTALCVALPARVGMMIIGGEGAVVLGGLMAALVGHLITNAPSLLVQIAMIASGMILGGLWIAAAGALRQYRGVNETISSLLMSYIAIAILNHCVEGPMRDPQSLDHPSSFFIGAANMLGNIPGTEVHVGLLFGIIACVFSWVLMDHTTHGFATSIVGGNPRAAKVAGLSIAKYSLAACFLGGAFAALAGVVEVAAIHGRANDSLAAGLGYAGILVAFVARQNPLAIIPVAILLGGVSASGDLLQMKLKLSSASVQVFQGILFLVILGLDTWAGRLKEVRHAWFARPIDWMLESMSKKPITTGAAHASVNS